ncbi:MAG: hypothetical protein P4L96_03200 [Rhodoferax sp.]|nr:hypothetical protein [Rhodoferax sp.]
MSNIDFGRLRVAMVEDQIAGRGVRANDVLEAMRAVPREVFLPAPLQEFANEDAALRIDEERTLPQPYLVALISMSPPAWRPVISMRSSIPVLKETHVNISSICTRRMIAMGSASWGSVLAPY